MGFLAGSWLVCKGRMNEYSFHSSLISDFFIARSLDGCLVLLPEDFSMSLSVQYLHISASLPLSATHREGNTQSSLDEAGTTPRRFR